HGRTASPRRTSRWPPRGPASSWSTSSTTPWSDRRVTDLGPALTLGQMVDRSAERFPDRAAIVFKGQRLSYARRRQRAADFARGPLGLGLRAGDRVGLWMPKRGEWTVATLGIAKVGGVTAPCNSRYKALEVGYVLRQSEARALVMVDRFAA